MVKLNRILLRKNFTKAIDLLIIEPPPKILKDVLFTLQHI